MDLTTVSNNSSLSRDRDYHDFSDLFLYDEAKGFVCIIMYVILEDLHEGKRHRILPQIIT